MASEQEFFIGIDFGGTFVKYALFSGNDRSLMFRDKTSSKADQSQEVIFGVLYDIIDELQDKAQQNGGKVVAIGMGSPGAIDFNQGKLIGSTPNIPDFTNADIRGKLKDRFDLPVWVDNDANLMALAESREGAAKGAANVIALTLGTGIGGGIIIDSQVYRGSFFAGAEIGHMTINLEGPPCNCGGKGCIERYASATAMVHNYRTKLQGHALKIPEHINTIMIFDQAEKGQQEAIDTINETCRYLGAALANLVNIFNPEFIVLGGGVSQAGPPFLEQISSELHRIAMPASAQDVKIVQAHLGNDAGIIGAMRLAFDQYQKMQK
jgi:glucokinase